MSLFGIVAKHFGFKIIAQNIENRGSNWSGGSVGSGMINQGHNDSAFAADAVANGLAFNEGSDYYAIAASSGSVPFDDNNGYVGTGNNSGQPVASGWNQKRTHTLSNGEIICCWKL